MYIDCTKSLKLLFHGRNKISILRYSLNICYVYFQGSTHVIFTDVQHVDKIDVKCFLLENIFHTTGRYR